MAAVRSYAFAQGTGEGPDIHSPVAPAEVRPEVRVARTPGGRPLSRAAHSGRQCLSEVIDDTDGRVAA